MGDRMAEHTKGVNVAAQDQPLDERLEESPLTYRAVLSSIEEGVVVYNSAGAVVFANESAGRILGSTRDQMMGSTPWTAGWRAVSEDESDLPPESHPAMAVMRTGQPVLGSLMGVRRPDGKLRWIRVSAQPLINQEGSAPHAVIATLFDVTEERLAAARLKESEEWFRAIGSTTPAAWIIYEGSKLVYANPAAEDLTGYSVDEAMSMSLLDMVHAEDRDMVATRMAARMSGDDAPSRYKIRLVRKDGAVRWVDLSARAFVTGEVRRGIAVLVDITEQREQQQALADSEARFRTVMEAAPFGLLLVDAEDRIRLANASAEKIFGYGPGELLGEWHEMLVPEKVRQRHSEGIRSFFSRIQPADFGTQMMHFTGDDCVLGRRRNGEEFPIELILSPIQAAGQRFVLAIATDVTERREAEQTRHHLVSILEATTDFVAMIGTDGKTTYMNGAGRALLEIPEGESLIGQELSSYFPDWALSKLQEEALPAAIDSGSWAGESAFLTRSGEIVSVSAVLLCHRDSAGNVSHYSSIARDIRSAKLLEKELRQAREAAESANRAKSAFLANMSHEIRTPLNAIIGMGELLETTPLTDEQREYVEILSTAGANLLDLINDVLDLSKIEAGHAVLERAEFDIVDLVDRVSGVMAVQARQKAVEIVPRVAPDVPRHLIGDPARLSQILVNLMGNAVKFTTVGEVCLEVGAKELMEDRQPEVELLISVHDTGIGMPPEMLDKVFDRFVQADASITREHGGTGLGLPIVKELVGLMGGEIWAESTPGKGSTFRFTTRFGIASQPILQRASPGLEITVGNVLVADDNAASRLILREMLAMWGAQVHEAESGGSCLQLYEQATQSGRRYDLVILDHEMPDMNGVQVARQMTRTSRPDPPPIILLTSAGADIPQAEREEAGIRATLAKPVRRVRLVQAISRVLSQPPGRGELTGAVVQAVEASIAPTTRRPRSIRLLLVEDSATNRLLVERHLEGAPCVVEVAVNGAQAVEMFKSGRYDLVLMDLQMPVMDGYTAVRAIRAWEAEQERSTTPVVAITAHALTEQLDKAIEAGFTSYLTKPIQRRTLVELIESYARGQVLATPGEALDALDTLHPEAIPTVRVDPQLMDLIPVFLQAMKDHLGTMESAHRDRNWERLRITGHSIKGSAGGYGFDEIGEMGRQIEDAAVRQDSEAVLSGIRRLKAYLRVVRYVS
jgi:two-component system, sensor histidine kinase and response regulator